MKTKYYIDDTSIEDNAMQGLQLFEKDENISKIAVFPDIHYCSEKNLPVGVAFESTDVFYPLITGKDMGCGVSYLKIDKKNYLQPFDKNKHYKAFDKASMLMTDEGLGGGNHFLSLEESEKYLYIICHTGTRNLGIYMYQKMLSMLEPGCNFLPIEKATEEFIIEYDKILNYGILRREQFLTKTFDFLVRNKYVVDKCEYEITTSIHNHLTFKDNKVIHRKGATELTQDHPVVIPLSMTRGSLIVKANKYTIPEETISSCSHGAGRKLSRTDTLKYWHSLKKSDKNYYKKQFPELLNKNGEINNGHIQEFDFAYKNSDSILQLQPYLIKVDETTPIVTVKFTEI